MKINGGVSVSVDAHLSEKTCKRVWKLSESLNFFEVVEVTKVPRLEAWPKSWETSGPTDDNIALYFFPPPSTRYVFAYTYVSLQFFCSDTQGDNNNCLIFSSLAQPKN